MPSGDAFRVAQVRTLGDSFCRQTIPNTYIMNLLTQMRCRNMKKAKDNTKDEALPVGGGKKHTDWSNPNRLKKQNKTKN